MAVLICPGCRAVYDGNIEICPKDNLPLIVRSPSMVGLDITDDGPLPTETTLSSGLMVGEYRIEGPIAEDDMGTTYAAIHPLIRKRVAIRVLHLRYAEDHRVVARFVMEARAVNEIGHHNIVDVLSIGELWDGRNYLVMEVLDGLGLDELLRREKHLAPGLLLPLFEQICDALNAVHAASFIHRDLKPENIVVLRRPPRPFVKIQDFAMAKLKSHDDGETDVATLVGTPTYMAPEHSTGKDVDARADIYSLGVVLYELLTGHAPYPAQALLQAFAGKPRPEPRPPSELQPGSPELDRVVLTAMAWDREKRQPSVLALWDELSRAIAKPLPWTLDLDPVKPTQAEPAQPPRKSTSPLARPPEPRQKSVLAPEAAMGDLEEDELRTKQAERKMLHLRPEPIPAGAQDDAPMDEAPTDIFCGNPAEDEVLAPPATLGQPDSLELEDSDDTVADPTLPPVPAVKPAAERIVATRTLVGVGPDPSLADTSKVAALLDHDEPAEPKPADVAQPADSVADTLPRPKPADVAQPAESPADTLPMPEPADVAQSLADAIPMPEPTDQPEEEDAYLSLEIITEPPDDKNANG